MKNTPSREKKLQKKSPEKKIRQLEILLELGRKITPAGTPESLLSILADFTKDLLDADRCSIFILDEKKKILWSKVAQDAHRTLSFPQGQGIAGHVLKTGRLANVRNAYSDKRFSPYVDDQTGYKTGSILTAPMKNPQGKVFGVFQVLNKKNGQAFDKEDEWLLTLLTSQAASAIENSRLYDQVKETTRDTIIRLSSAAEFKDRETASHIIRMSKYSTLVAEALGMSPGYCENLHFASPMHDIGKIGIPDAILLKPGKLDPEEWKEMKKHTIYGADILKDSGIELIQIARQVALSHHEKFDGTGYPYGLKGKDIPLEGRIAAIADVFDALISKRPYKEKIAVDDALSIIRHSKGNHFDPQISDAFERSLTKILETMHGFPDTPRELRERELSREK